MKKHESLPENISNEIINLYKQKNSTYIIAEKLCIDRNLIYRFLKWKGFSVSSKTGPRYKKYLINENYFDEIDNSEKAYWLGMLAADGCVYINKKGSYYLSLGLKKSDRHHLELFKQAIGSNHPIKERSHVTRGKKLQQNVIVICNVHICKSLIKQGIIPRKTFNLIFPKINKDLISHYIRGFVDGDGSWAVRRNQLSFRIISVMKEFLSYIQDILIKECSINKNIIHTNNEGVSYFTNEGNLQCERIYNFLYKEANIYLQRKFELIDSHLKNVLVKKGL